MVQFVPPLPKKKKKKPRRPESYFATVVFTFGDRAEILPNFLSGKKTKNTQYKMNKGRKIPPPPQRNDYRLQKYPIASSCRERPQHIVGYLGSVCP